MASVIGVLLLGCLTVLQAALVGHLRLLDGRPDIVLLAVVGWSLVAGPRLAMTWGLTAGLFLDLRSGHPFGTCALTLTVIAYLTSQAASRFWSAHPLMPLAAMLIASAIFYAAQWGALFLTGRTLDPTYAALHVALPGIFLDLLLVLPASQLMESLHRMLFPPQVTV